MMRTNSRGSVISIVDDTGLAEPDALRTSLEIIEQRMESLRIPEEPDTPVLAAQQPRKVERTASSHSHPDTSTQVDEHPPSRGHITPPEIFPQKPGHESRLIGMGADARTGAAPDLNATPMPTKIADLENEPTPRPQGSPSTRS